MVNFPLFFVPHDPHRWEAIDDDDTFIIVSKL